MHKKKYKMTNGSFRKLEASIDKLAEVIGLRFQEQGIIAPANDGDKTYFLKSKPLGVGLYVPAAMCVAASTPQEAIQRWTESSICPISLRVSSFPRKAYQIDAFESIQAYRSGRQPLLTIQGNDKIF